MLLKGELFNAPIGSSPQNILDLGTGTGIWAMDIAEYVKPLNLHIPAPESLTFNPRMFPSAHVIGNDISPIQPSWMAPNVEFIIEDIESEWQYEQNHFDFIHARCLAGYLRSPVPLLNRSYFLIFDTDALPTGLPS